jgi:hypothetical protein
MDSQFSCQKNTLWPSQSDCPDQFDFSLLFEQSFLSLLPSSFLILIASFRAISLKSKPRRTRGRKFLLLKLVATHILRRLLPLRTFILSMSKLRLLFYMPTSRSHGRAWATVGVNTACSWQYSEVIGHNLYCQLYPGYVLLASHSVNRYSLIEPWISCPNAINLIHQILAMVSSVHMR